MSKGMTARYVSSLPFSLLISFLDLTASDVSFVRLLGLFTTTRRTGRSDYMNPAIPHFFVWCRDITKRKEVHIIMMSEVIVDFSYLQRLYWI